MSKHQFGIMELPPQKGERYDEYQFEKYAAHPVYET